MITMCMITLPAALVPEERYALLALGASAGSAPLKQETRADGTMVGVSCEQAGLFAPGQLLDLAVGEAVNGGWCVARPRPGAAGANDQHPEPAQRVVFVRHALPGERVKAVVTQANARFARADAIEIITAVPERVPVPCPYAVTGGCGGCDWQHASLAAQRAMKSAVVSQQLRRIAGIERTVTVEPVPGDTDGLGWRTRVRFAVDSGGRAGLYRHRSHEVVPVSDCLIAHPLVRQAAVTRTAWPSARWVEVVAAPGTGERAVFTDAEAARQGQQFLAQRAAGRDWRVSATGFWQVHPGAADLLAGAVVTALHPAPGETALDLFCGAGLFASVLAERVGSSGTVIGIERDATAVRDARYNLRSVPWARVYRGDAAVMLSRIGLSGASVAVLDPPRAGAGRRLIETLCGAASQPGKPLRTIAYVSCDPATLARDIEYFARLGWQLDGLRAFDAFPMTHHVECLATIVPPVG
jgi:tRNA/tmRNA/rRNA uracil-C5-methylase (TrmA/RlmC/RlmD family)